MQGEKMDEEIKAEIHRLQRELDKAVQANLRWQTLVLSREELEKNEQKLTEEIHLDNLASHQKQDYDPEAASNLAQRVNQRHELLDEVKRKKQEIDKLLDIIEEHSEEKIQTLREQLIGVILSAYPDQKPFYETLKTSLDSNTAYEKELASSVQACEQLMRPLEAAIEVRQMVKYRGFLSYVFGVNPTASISQYLQATESIAALMIPRFTYNSSRTLGGEPMQKTYTELLAFLTDLRAHCKKQWGFQHIDTTFASSLKTLKVFHNTFQEALDKTANEGKILLKKRDNWIKEH
jgi:hypothetical protein